MPFCIHCGKQLQGEGNICIDCYNATLMPAPTPPPPVKYDSNVPEIVPYVGQARKFTFFGAEWNVSPDIDAANYYRNALGSLARVQADAFRKEYLDKIDDAESYLKEYPDIFAKHRRPLVNAAMRLFMQLGLYDVSVDEFDSENLATCAGPDTYYKLREIVDESIENYREERLRRLESMPGLFFSGAGGIAAAFAYNAIINKAAQNAIDCDELDDDDLEELDEVLEQEQQAIIEGAFADYWNIYQTTLQVLEAAGILSCLPTEEDNRRCDNLCQNLDREIVPPTQVPKIMVEILRLNPFCSMTNLAILDRKFGQYEETRKILEYLGYFNGISTLSII